jgi:hypothetical protein
VSDLFTSTAKLTIVYLWLLGTLDSLVQPGSRCRADAAGTARSADRCTVSSHWWPGTPDIPVIFSEGATTIS